MNLDSKVVTATKIENGNIESAAEPTLHDFAERGRLATDMFVE